MGLRWSRDSEGEGGKGSCSSLLKRPLRMSTAGLEPGEPQVSCQHQQAPSPAGSPCSCRGLGPPLCPSLACALAQDSSAPQSGPQWGVEPDWLPGPPRATPPSSRPWSWGESGEALHPPALGGRLGGGRCVSSVEAFLLPKGPGQKAPGGGHCAWGLQGPSSCSR